MLWVGKKFILSALPFFYCASLYFKRGSRMNLPSSNFICLKIEKDYCAEAQHEKHFSDKGDHSGIN